MRLPPPAIRWPASAGISGISLCIRSRMIALTAFIAVAVSERMGASDGSFTGRGTTSALMRGRWRFERLLASAESLLALRAMASQAQPEMTQDQSDPVLAGYRKSIDNIDAALIHMLAERFRITQAVGEYKAQVALPAADPEREGRQVQRLRKLAEEADLDPEFSEKFIRFVIEEVIRHHQRHAAAK